MDVQVNRAFHSRCDCCLASFLSPVARKGERRGCFGRSKPDAMMSRFELTRLPVIKSAVKNRWPQLAVFIVMLAGYLFAILAGLIGTHVGSRNFSIVFVWIAWWAMLILVAVPFFGRGWCAICPIPLP